MGSPRKIRPCQRDAWQHVVGEHAETLLDHYHLHCIVSGGGVALDGKRWVSAPTHYLFPVRAPSVMFRGKYLAGLKALFGAGALEFHGEQAPLAEPKAFAALLGEAARPAWVVYAKRPFAGPKPVLAYLSRYTHRVAISNRRLLAADGQSVSFAYKDYAQNAQPKTMTLARTEFVRRFCLHVLPERFVKIRHYGLLGNRKRQERLAPARQLLGAAPPPAPAPEQTQAETTTLPQAPRVCCPFCRRPALVLVGEVAPAWAARPARLNSS